MYRNARHLREQGFRHTAYLGMFRYHARQRAAVSADYEETVVLFELRKATQLVEYTNRRLHPRAYAICGHVALVRYAAPYLS